VRGAGPTSGRRPAVLTAITLIPVWRAAQMAGNHLPPARHPCSTGRQEPAAEGQLDYSGFARRGERCPGWGRRVSYDALRPGHADRCCLCGGCLARAVARAFIRDCCLQPTVPRTAVSYAIASARQPTTTQSDRILLQLTEHVSGEYVTLPVSRRGPRRPGWDSWNPRPGISGLPDAARRRGLRHSRARRLSRTPAVGNAPGEDGVVRVLGHRQIMARGRAGG
jgi:hypothetical protein